MLDFNEDGTAARGKSGRWHSARWWNGHHLERDKCERFADYAHAGKECSDLHHDHGRHVHPPMPHDLPKDFLARLAAERDAGLAKREAERATGSRGGARAELRARYVEHMATAWAAADHATRGWMVNAAGEAKGITGQDLYEPSGRRASTRYASDELRSAWQHGHAPRPVSLQVFAGGRDAHDRTEKSHRRTDLRVSGPLGDGSTSRQKRKRRAA